MKYAGQHDIQSPVVIDGRRTRNYVCLVDAHRRPGRCRNTAGRYRIGAKNAKQARRLLQAAIGFGSVTVLREDGTDTVSSPVPFGACVRETYDPETGRFAQAPARHASEPATGR